MIKIHHFFCNLFEERCYVVWDEGDAVVIDPGFLGSAETDELDAFLAENRLQLRAVLLTHAHFDHIYGVRHCVDRHGTPVYLHPDEAVVLQGASLLAGDCRMSVPDTDWPFLPVKDGDVLRFGALSFRVISTPGHSPGSVCYYCEDGKHLFSGDTLFAGTIGNTQLRWGDYDRLIVSVMDKLMGLDGDVTVYPGHGGGTTIGYERTHNPFLQPFNEKDPETGWVDGIEV